MWIKVCGLCDAAAVSAALEARADALGWVFADSPRRVLPAQAAALARVARGRGALVAVTLHPTQSLVDEIMRELAPDYLQSDAADLAALRLPRELQRLPVLRDTGLAAPDGGEGEGALPELPPRILFEGRRSGSGTAANWSVAGRLARRTQLVLAGGLSAHNVARAISSVQPFGVDVSSGVETAPGRKSAALIGEFVAAARAAGEVAA